MVVSARGLILSSLVHQYMSLLLEGWSPATAALTVTSAACCCSTWHSQLYSTDELPPMAMTNSFDLK